VRPEYVTAINMRFQDITMLTFLAFWAMKVLAK
jgi:hypothetical protein